MRIRPIPLSAIAASLLLAGCYSDPVTPVATTTPVYAPVAGTVVTSPGAVVTQQPGMVVQQATPMVVVPAQPAVIAGYRAGLGRVNSITRIPDASHHEGSASPVRRIGITMDDGTVQWVDTRAQGMSIGDRVELTADHRINFPVATR